MKIVSGIDGNSTRIYDDNDKEITRELHVFDIQINIGPKAINTAILKCYVSELDIDVAGVTIIQSEPEEVE